MSYRMGVSFAKDALIMLSRIFNFGRGRHRREAVVRDLIAAVNRMDYVRASELLTEDFSYYDASGKGIEGRDRFIEEDRRFREASGNAPIVVESLDNNRGEVLLRGYLDSDIEQISGPTLWRIVFEGDKIACADVTRSHSQMTLPAFANRKNRQSA